jgi:hypothetical protein
MPLRVSSAFSSFPNPRWYGILDVLRVTSMPLRVEYLSWGMGNSAETGYF